MHPTALHGLVVVSLGLLPTLGLTSHGVGFAASILVHLTMNQATF